MTHYRSIRFLVVIALAAIALFATAGVIYAQDQTEESVVCPMGGGAWRWGGLAGGPLTPVADLLGLTPDELIVQLREGRSLLGLAQEKGITPDQVVEAVVVSRLERLSGAVESGRITQEQSDAMIAQMKERLTEKIQSENWPYVDGRRSGGGRMMGRWADRDNDGNSRLFGPKGRMFGGRFNTQPSSSL